MIAGRGEEQLAITAVLDAARDGRGSALALLGEPGIGKSTLLEWACQEAAEGLTVVRTVGVESDFSVPYAGRLDVAGPLRPALEDVPDAQRVALEGALGWTPSPAGTPLLVAAAAMTLLPVAASRRPVVVVVDDLQWLDPESVRVLDFAARRLHRDPVAFLTARREGHPASVGGNVRETRPPGPGRARRRSPAHRTGSGRARPADRGDSRQPLALLEAAAALTPPKRRGSAALPESVAIGDRLLQGCGAAAARLADAVLDTASPPEARARALLTLGVVEQYAGSVPRARALQSQAAATGSGLIPRHRIADSRVLTARSRTLAASGGLA